MENNKLDKRTKWSYCIGATGRDMAYALVSMFLLTYIQYTMKLTVAQRTVCRDQRSDDCLHGLGCSQRSADGNYY